MKRWLFLLSGAAALGWWWWNRRNAAAAADAGAQNTTPVSDSTAPVINLTPFVPPAPAANANNPAGTLSAAQQQQQQQAARASNSWVWTGGSDAGKIVPLSEFNSWFSNFGDTKCAGGDCSKLGRPCLAGYNCAPGQPGWVSTP